MWEVEHVLLKHVHLGDDLGEISVYSFNSHVIVHLLLHYCCLETNEF